VPLLVRLLLRLLFGEGAYLRVDSCEESDGNLGDRVPCAGVLACGRKPGGKVFALGSAGAWACDSGILARHLV